MEKIKIAVIHDEEHVRLLYNEELKEAGYNVAIHPSMREGAVEFIREENPELVILGEEGAYKDNVFPKELVFEIRRNFPEIRVIFVTCYDTFELKDAEGADRVVIMSFDLTELKQAIGKLLVFHVF